MSFIVEMKRRKVLRAAFVYLVMSWLVLQITDVVAPILDLPAWVAKLIFFLLAGGLPVALVLAWEFDLTSLGIYREKPLVEPGVRPATAGERNQEASRRLGLFASVWVMIIGTGLSVGAATVIHLHEARMIDRQFDLVAEDVANELRHHLKADSQVLRTLGALFVDNHYPGLDTFQHVSETVIAEREEIIALEWVPLVSDVDREHFVNKMRDDYPGFELKAFDANGKEIPPEQRDMYFPVTYTVPKLGNENAIGFDLLSNPQRAATLRDAILYGETRQTGPIELVQTEAAGFLMFNPVFMDDEVPVSQSGRFEDLRGFTLAVINIRKLVMNAITATPATTNFLGEVIVYDAESDSDIPVFWVDNGGASELASFTRAVAVVDGGFGLKYRVELRPTRAMMVAMFSNEHYIVGAIGILLSIIFVVIINMVSSAREIPNVTSDLADVREKVTGEPMLEPGSGPTQLPGVTSIRDGRYGFPSRWQPR